MSNRVRQRLIFLFSSVFGLGAFYVFSRLVKRGYLTQFDFDMTVRLQDNLPVRLDPYWEDIAFFVSPISSIVAVIILIIVAFIIHKRFITRISSAMIGISFALLVAAEVYGKTIVTQNAPPFFLLKNPTAHFPTYHVFDVNSYPSGHAGRSMFLAIILGYFVYTRVKKQYVRIATIGLLVSLVLAVAVGKVYLGQHWTSDIIGGWIVGVAFAIAAIGIIRLADTIRLNHSSDVTQHDTHE